MAFVDIRASHNRECVVCGKSFKTIYYKKVCCSDECKKERKRQKVEERKAAHPEKKKYQSQRRLDLEKDKRDGQQGYIMSEKDEKKKAARKKITPMDEWAEAKRNGCTLSYGKWQAQRYIEEMRRGE